MTPYISSFRLGLRLAIIPAAVIFLLSAIGSYYLTNNTWLSLFWGLIISLVSFALIYINSFLLLNKRITDLRRLAASAPRKAEIHNDHDISYSSDEMDQLLELSKKSRQKVHEDFRRMDETDNYRKEFIGDISHELKTPIFSVQGYLETLKNGALEDPEVNQLFLSKAIKNVNRLIYLTNDLMEISKLETGELKPELQIIALNNIINDVIDTLQYKAEQVQVSITFSHRETNSFAVADRNQIRQVLINLVENAIKYNKPGGRVYISTFIEKDDPRHVTVSVKDTGIGIEPENHTRVTERFYRVDKSRSREQGGTGLGLSIVKHILESHDSYLNIKSKPGSGSLFSFKLKIADHYSHHVSA